MIPEEIKIEVIDNKLIPFYKLESVSSIINFMKTFPEVKKFSIENSTDLFQTPFANDNFIIYIRMKWYYIWPFNMIYIKNLNKQIQLLKSKHITIKIKHMKWQF